MFYQTRGHFSKKYNLCPHVQLQTVVWLFWWFWSSGFFLAERPFRLCQYRTRLTVGIDTVVPVSCSIFTRSFVVLLGLICTFHTKSTLISRETELVSFLSGMTAAWSHGVYTCVLLVVQMNVVPSGVWKLLPRMKQTCGGLKKYSEVLADFFWFSHDAKQRGTEFEGRSWKVHLQLTQMMSISLSEASKAFSGIFQAV